MKDETANQRDILDRLTIAIKNLNELLREADNAALSIEVTFPLLPDMARISLAYEGEGLFSPSLVGESESK